MIEWHDRIGSTMDLAHTRAEQGAPHGTAIAAREQTAGRGRRGSLWLSPAGGLWLSVVCRPAGAEGMEHLSLRIGLRVAETIERLFPDLPRLSIKPPNDVLLGSRKLAGILCEARWEGGAPTWVIAAVGLNVANPIPVGLRDQATRLADHLPDLRPEPLAPPLARAIADAAAEPGPLTQDETGRLALREPVR